VDLFGHHPQRKERIMSSATHLNRLAGALLSILLMLGTGPVAAQGSTQGTEPSAMEESTEEAQSGSDKEERQAARAQKAADVEAQYADLRKRFETALAAGDADGIGALFARKSLVLPLTGDKLEGRREIERFYRDVPKPEAVVIRSQQVDLLGRTVLDVGTISTKMPTSAGGKTLESEYVLLAKGSKKRGMQIERLMLFPLRQAISASTQ
jgi:uncharacterized protein (TIGR02246 family)